MATVIDQICTHLEFLGYETNKTDSGTIRATHKSYFNIIFKEYGYGVLFSAFFSSNPTAKSDRKGFLESVNSFNRIARVSRCYIDKDEDIAFEACMPSNYEKASFGTFMEIFNSDMKNGAHDDVKLFDFLK